MSLTALAIEKNRITLTALVVAMSGMAAIVARFQPAAPAGGVTDEEIAAIGAAIRQHRRR